MARNKEKKKTYNAIYNASHKKERSEYYRTHKETYNAYRKRFYNTQKTQIMSHYGGAFCACCGEKELDFLTIDHINNDGAEHRRHMGYVGLYRWLQENYYPTGFQVLCRNCNWGKYINKGICSHKKNKLRVAI